jgi:hypothetical protein
MARAKKTPEKKRRGSAAGVKPQARARKPAPVQASLPNVPDGRIAKLEELDAERTEALQDKKSAGDLAKDCEARMVVELEKEAAKSGRDRYRTNSGFVIDVAITKKLRRKRVPKAKARKGQAVPAGVAS